MIKFQAIADKVEAKFRELGSTSPTTIRALEAFARVLRTRIQLGFRMARSPWGAPWRKLAPGVSRQGQPLRNTGRLYGSIGVRRTGNGITVGTNLQIPGRSTSLGAVHQFGMTIRPKNGKFLVWTPPGRKGLVFAEEVTIPARPFMPIRPSGQVDLPPDWARSALSAMARALEIPT